MRLRAGAYPDQIAKTSGKSYYYIALSMVGRYQLGQVYLAA